MKCLITNCNHTESRRMRLNRGTHTCWDDLQICPCCDLILFAPIDSLSFINTARCNNSIKKELHVEPEPDYPMIIKIKRKKKLERQKEMESMYSSATPM